MPEVNPEIICWHVCLTVTVDRYWVDMIGVTISKDSPGSDFYHQIHRFQYRHLPKKKNQRKSMILILIFFFASMMRVWWRASIQRWWNYKISQWCMQIEFLYGWIAGLGHPRQGERTDTRAMENQAEWQKAWTTGREALAAATVQASLTARASVPHMQEVVALASKQWIPSIWFY